MPPLYDSNNVYDNVCLHHDNVYLQYDNIRPIYDNVCLLYEDVCLKYDNVCLSLSILHGRPVWRHAAGLDRYLAFACRFELHTIPPMNDHTTAPPLTHTACVYVYDNVCLQYDNIYLQYDNVFLQYDDVCLCL